MTHETASEPSPPSGAKRQDGEPDEKLFRVPDWLPQKWQSMVDTITALADVPVGLVMRVVGDDIEVLVSSQTVGNPYKPGEAMRLPGSGLYCEDVIRRKEVLIVANALLEERWCKNPDVGLGMISYLGVPIRWPDDRPFGTLCILDRVERQHFELYEKLLALFRDIIEHHLSLIYSDSQRELLFEADRAQQHEALRSSEQRFKLLVEHASEDFILHDNAGKILDTNQQACRNSGLTKDELRRTNITEVKIDWGDRWNPTIWSVTPHDETVTIETSYTLADGHVAAVEVRCSCQLVQGERLFLILIHDVSERQRAEEAVRVAAAELARASRLTMMGHLAGSIIHEVNQPLAAIVARSAACSRWLDQDPPRIDQARESVRLLSESAHHAAAIVSSLRSIAQKSTTHRTEIDLNEIVNDVLLLTRRECARAGSTCEADLTGESTMISGDAIQIKQVVLNLVMNALEAMKETKGRQRALKVISLRVGLEVAIVVEDTGPGLYGQSSDRLFEPMFTTKAQGMGMGLAVCHSIMQAHDATISAEDRSDRNGARFRLSFRAA